MKLSTISAGGFALALLFLSAAATPAAADVLYNNLPPLATSGGTAAVSTADHGPLGDSFSTGSTAENLTDVELLIDVGNVDPPADSFTVDLYSDSSTSPGSLLDTIATVDDSSLTNSLAVYDFTLGTPYSLAADTRYWIELSGDSTSGQWSYDVSNTGIGVAGEFNYYDGTSFANSAFTPYQMEVMATPASAVPEPPSWTLMIGAILALGSTLAFSRRRLPVPIA
jgi:hypothetical protein